MAIMSDSDKHKYTSVEMILFFQWSNFPTRSKNRSQNIILNKSF